MDAAPKLRLANTLLACPEHLFIPCERAATSDSSDVPAASWCASSF